MAASGLVDNLYMTYSGNMLTVVQRMEYYPFGAQFCGYSDSTCIKGTGKLIRYQGREISQEILCHD